MKIAVVVVTYNRLDKIKRALSAYEQQKTHFDDLIVVDNKSTDGTREFLSEWRGQSGVSQRHVILMDQNMGSSAGFHDGCEYALSLGPDWIFIADDDAYLADDAVSIFKDFAEKDRESRLSAVCASVLRLNGEYAYVHRKNFKMKYGFLPRFSNCGQKEYDKDYFHLDIFSYVGTFMKADCLRRAGLCNRDFFIYYDDTEHSVRMKKYGDIICIPRMKIYHDDGADTERKTSEAPVTWRNYYAVRNVVFFYLHLSALAGFLLAVDLFLKSFWQHKSRVERKMIQNAIYDGLSGKLGLHGKYRPGFVCDL